MTRKEIKKRKDYPKTIAFDENLEGVGNAFVEASINIPDIAIVVKGATNHNIATEIDEQVVFFTCDRDWLTRQPPYKHGGIIYLDLGNASVTEKTGVIGDFIYAFHRKNKVLDTLKNKRLRLTRTRIYEVTADGGERIFA